MLSEHPDVAVRVREEVDRVIGDRAVTFEDIMEVSELPRYLTILS